MPETTPAETLRKAAALMRKLASEATPGPWERPLDTRHKDSVIAALPEGEEPRTWQGGIIPAGFAGHKGPTGRYAGQRERVGVVSAGTWSIGGFIRKRSGRDLEYVAAMHPLVGLALAEWLENEAAAADLVGDDADTLNLPDKLAVALACIYLGEVPNA